MKLTILRIVQAGASRIGGSKDRLHDMHIEDAYYVEELCIQNFYAYRIMHIELRYQDFDSVSFRSLWIRSSLWGFLSCVI